VIAKARKFLIFNRLYSITT